MCTPTWSDVQQWSDHVGQTGTGGRLEHNAQLKGILCILFFEQTFVLDSINLSIPRNCIVVSGTSIPDLYSEDKYGCRSESVHP